MTNDIEQRIIAAVDGLGDMLFDVSQEIHKNPELGGEEFRASALLCDRLRQHGFSVQQGLYGMPTAFRAHKGTRPGPRVGFLAEYDALPGLGHACGHNLIAAIGLGAAVALGEVIDELGGEVVLFGTPAEETNGAKVIFCENGAFRDVDFAMMIHPGDRTTAQSNSLAMDAIEFAYEGKAAHAAASPHEGINALDAVIQLFNGINALRQHVKDEVRIHGIITEGGKAPNIVPDRAVARFYVRAASRTYLDAVVGKVMRCAEGAALATGARLSTRNFELSFDNMVTNSILANQLEQAWRDLGVERIMPARPTMGSTDMGNVSHVVPSVHGYIQIVPEGIPAHTPEYCQAAGAPESREAILLGAKSLALAASRVMSDGALLESIKREFQEAYK
ncbi:MAG: M20 family metallopeptidase [Bacillota bacterium]